MNTFLKGLFKKAVSIEIEFKVDLNTVSLPKLTFGIFFNPHFKKNYPKWVGRVSILSGILRSQHSSVLTALRNEAERKEALLVSSQCKSMASLKRPPIRGGLFIRILTINICLNPYFVLLLIQVILLPESLVFQFY